jgi:hypothetical protein
VFFSKFNLPHPPAFFSNPSQATTLEVYLYLSLATGPVASNLGFAVTWSASASCITGINLCGLRNKGYRPFAFVPRLN